jgi:hypothetical protein
MNIEPILLQRDLSVMFVLTIFLFILIYRREAARG